MVLQYTLIIPNQDMGGGGLLKLTTVYSQRIKALVQFISTTAIIIIT